MGVIYRRYGSEGELGGGLIDTPEEIYNEILVTSAMCHPFTLSYHQVHARMKMKEAFDFLLFSEYIIFNSYIYFLNILYSIHIFVFVITFKLLVSIEGCVMCELKELKTKFEVVLHSQTTIEKNQFSDITYKQN